MQTLGQIRDLLAEWGFAPQRRFGQNFLFDQNLMNKLLEEADLGGNETVLEVGPGTGSLTEELLQRAGKVVCVEIDRGLCDLLQRRLGGNRRLTLICGDVLAGKGAISPQVLEALGASAHLVANLPYSIATPLIATCLLSSHRSARGGGHLFERLTFTVQREVGERLSAGPDGKTYGPISVIIALLGRIKTGPVVPASAFWPRPKVSSRIVRIDFDRQRAGLLADADMLTRSLALAFGQRRKQLGSVVRRKGTTIPAEIFLPALDNAGIGRSLRAENVSPQQYLALANELAKIAAG
ncbi:MAG: ribosomal RNA small subunit methyltransferase A [Phycisphaerae bacterium]|nr:ribosomal RNA small subunit methyltransferase A [Phycisphaerae bacterium]